MSPLTVIGASKTVATLLEKHLPTAHIEDSKSLVEALRQLNLLLGKVSLQKTSSSKALSVSPKSKQSRKRRRKKKARRKSNTQLAISRGAHFHLDDNGAFYDLYAHLLARYQTMASETKPRRILGIFPNPFGGFFQSKPLATRISSHQSTVPQIEVNFPGQPGVTLVGKIGEPGKERTWFQKERHSWKQHPVKHARDYAIYRATQKQVGPSGKSTRTDKRPIIIDTQTITGVLVR